MASQRHYNVEKALSLTKTRSKAALISKTRRPDHFKNKETSQGQEPGAYETCHKKFGTDVKKITIQPKREKKIKKSVGPGEYDVERAEKLLRTSSPIANISKTRRPSGFATKEHSYGVGPGQYDSEKHKKFGADTKPMTIGKKNEKPKKMGNVGPGYYEPNLAEKIIKQKITAVKFDKSPMRPSLFGNKKNETHLGPGSYTDKSSWNQNTKSFKIGEKREKKIEKVPGPGQYDVTKSEKVTKVKVITFDIR